MKSILAVFCLLTILNSWTNAIEDSVGGRRVYVNNDKENWFSASDICRTHDTELLEIYTSEENEEANALLQKYNINEAWIGLNDLGTEEHYVWSANGKRSQNVFWAKAAWDNKGTEQDCVTVSANPAHPENWFDRKCTDKYSYICQDTRCVTWRK